MLTNTNYDLYLRNRNEGSFLVYTVKQHSECTIHQYLYIMETLRAYLCAGLVVGLLRILTSFELKNSYEHPTPDAIRHFYA